VTAGHRYDFLDLALRAFETRSDADLILYLQSLLSDIRFLAGHENCSVIGVLESPVTGAEQGSGE
jgi:hypothetical protein